jgi:hypothetical protein
MNFQECNLIVGNMTLTEATAICDASQKRRNKKLSFYSIYLLLTSNLLWRQPVGPMVFLSTNLHRNSPPRRHSATRQLKLHRRISLFFNVPLRP